MNELYLDPSKAPGGSGVLSNTPMQPAASPLTPAAAPMQAPSPFTGGAFNVAPGPAFNSMSPTAYSNSSYSK